MNITKQNPILIELTGPLERAAGCSQILIPCESSQTLGAVFAWLLNQYPATKDVLGDFSFYTATEGNLPPGLLVICDSVKRDNRCSKEPAYRQPCWQSELCGRLQTRCREQWQTDARTSQQCEAANLDRQQNGWSKKCIVARLLQASGTE